jgi:hypothetical protein
MELIGAEVIMDVTAVIDRRSVDRLQFLQRGSICTFEKKRVDKSDQMKS